MISDPILNDIHTKEISFNVM